MNLSWFLDPIRKHYFDFNGRASRKQYWMFTLYYLIVFYIVIVISSIVHLAFLSSILSFALFLPFLGLSVRRLHDINKSGKWLLLYFSVSIVSLIMLVFVPVLASSLSFVVSLVMIYFLVQKGNLGSNKYGEDPLGGVAATPVTLAPQAEQQPTVPPTTPTV